MKNFAGQGQGQQLGPQLCPLGGGGVQSGTMQPMLAPGLSLQSLITIESDLLRKYLPPESRLPLSPTHVAPTQIICIRMGFREEQRQLGCFTVTTARRKKDKESLY